MNEDQTVFLVDDEPAIVKALSRLLRAAGYRIEAFSSAREFMDHYKVGVGGCLVLDLSMPGITGIDVQQWLASSGGPLPVVFMTGQDDLPEKVQAMMKGAVDVLMKPVSASALLKNIEKALARDRGNRGGHTGAEQQPNVNGK
jgi:FixJ family two-component response regulator